MVPLDIKTHFLVGGGRWEGGSGWGTHVNPWLIHVNVWQKPLQYCKVISLQLIKIIGVKKKDTFLFFFFKIYLFYLLGESVLGLHCYKQAFSSCGEQGLLFAACSGFSLQWILLLRSTDCRCMGFSNCSAWAQ